MSEIESSQRIYDAGRVIKYLGIVALAVQLFVFGITEVFAFLVRLMESNWFWVFLVLIIIGVLMQKFSRPKLDSYLGTGPKRGDAGGYSVEDDSPDVTPGL